MQGIYIEKVQHEYPSYLSLYRIMLLIFGHYLAIQMFKGPKAMQSQIPNSPDSVEHTDSSKHTHVLASEHACRACIWVPGGKLPHSLLGRTLDVNWLLPGEQAGQGRGTGQSLGTWSRPGRPIGLKGHVNSSD